MALFFKSRARVEEAYARSLTEMSRDLTDNYHKGDGKAGSVLTSSSLRPVCSCARTPNLTSLVLVRFPRRSTFFKAYQDTLRIHDVIAGKRNGFATRLNEMSDELSVLAKEMEKTRKQVRSSALSKQLTSGQRS